MMDLEFRVFSSATPTEVPPRFHDRVPHGATYRWQRPWWSVSDRKLLKLELGPHVIHVDSAVASIVPSAVQAVLVHWYTLLSSADSHTHTND